MEFDNAYRLERLRNICETVKTFSANESISNKDREWDAIIVLPEYYFTRIMKHGAAARAMPVYVKNKLLYELGEISKNYSRILIIPGTIAFRKPLIRPLNELLTKKGRLRKLNQCEKLAIELQNEQKLSRREKLLANLKRDNINSSFYAKRPGNKIGRNPASSDQLYWLRHILRGVDSGAAALNNFHIFQNKSYVLLNGEIKFTYEKKAGFFELQGVIDRNQYFAPNYKRKNCAIIDDKVFCFEICFDHAKGVAKSYVKSQISRAKVDADDHGINVPDATPDFHILMSDYVQEDSDSIAAKPGGYFIHASTRDDITCVKKVGSPTNSGVTRLCHQDYEGSFLSIYKVE
jgi:hypothetical protein